MKVIIEKYFLKLLERSIQKGRRNQVNEVMIVRNKITNPIEGFFIHSKDDLIFDVKGLSHPNNRIISFVRYVPKKFFLQDNLNELKKYHKLYDLNDRFHFLRDNFPKYIFKDPKGRGFLQGVLKEDLLTIYNPISRLIAMTKTPKNSLDDLETQALELVTILEKYSGVKIDHMGISGSILVNLHSEQSDIDLIVYGKENGLKIYEAMSDIFEKEPKIQRYNASDLQQLRNNRGQIEQIDLQSFIGIESRKQLQGMINKTDFYIRLVLLPEEYYEPYNRTLIIPLGEVEITATVQEDELSIFTPCIYNLTNVESLSSEKLLAILPDRIFSLRGRYCDLAKKGEKIHIRGCLEKVTISRRKEYYQLTLGSSKRDFFKKC
ncbi:MAG: hypothetical protein JXA54_14020 [Candidatus Heimdallarchaeota archaeon]|nr:hypothetical protein [Candidatus Heimdallarchaeota archaeon]